MALISFTFHRLHGFTDIVLQMHAAVIVKDAEKTLRGRCGRLDAKLRHLGWKDVLEILKLYGKRDELVIGEQAAAAKLLCGNDDNIWGLIWCLLRLPRLGRSSMGAFLFSVFGAV